MTTTTTTTSSTSSPMSTAVLIGIIIFVAAIVGFIVYQNKKRKDASWEGIVIDKAMTESVHDSSDYNRSNSGGIQIGGGGFTIGGGNNNTTNVTHNYSIEVRPNGGGESFKWSISSGFYEMVNIGDNVVKRSGTQTPEIIATKQKTSGQ